MNLDVMEESPDELIEEVNSIGNPCVPDEAVQTSTLGNPTLEGKIEHLTWAVEMLTFLVVVVVVLV